MATKKQRQSELKAEVRSYYPQAFDGKQKFWRVYRDPSEPTSGIYLAGAVTRLAAWEKAVSNIKNGPQCCFPHPLDYVVSDEGGNAVMIGIAPKGRVMIDVIEHCPKGESRTSQMLITDDEGKIREIRDALTRILESGVMHERPSTEQSAKRQE